MAGAIAGAYVGYEQISENLQKHCEFNKEMLEMADDLYNAFESSAVTQNKFKN